MINIDISLVIQIVNFVFLIFVLNMLLYKPIRSIVIQRKEKVAGLEQNIETSSREAKEKDEAYSSGIKEARAEGLKEKGELLQTAGDEEKEVIRKINKKAQENLAEIQEKIKKDSEEVRKSLQQEIDVFADAIGQKILGRVV